MSSRSPEPVLLRGEPAARARAIAAGELTANPAVPAATVLLLRDGGPGLEVLVLRRHKGMAFAAGMLAFPGGRVAPADAAPTFVSAAVREVAEETGVTLSPDALVPWAHWITPTFELRRYDTWFYVAPMPADQAARNASTEATVLEWRRPVDCLDEPMMPPTRHVLSELAGFGSVAEVVAAGAGRLIEPVLPAWVAEGDAVRLLLPGDAGYPGDRARDRLAVGGGALGGRPDERPRDVRARAEPGPDDPRRHQYLGARRAGGDSRDRRRPRA